ncbi:cytochrome c oxidase cbb3-type subunit 3 [Roseovarius nanhaiticus]|uniref:Cbb3-type cytochrome c oxidase subunit n=1 Tax=Roseovarius nanhaiticus TaxID=573024 RepID=A0A1N7HBV4_9RHOB|nr:cytochrome-c oxidase, cbb3-type subunit III [Roseovarius nanhaiticus]SEL03545.1 cytochrome c oxidase cbb3-type subunit 3 [Roseovarius nanhaiticus]SIS22369.1 cytochrome c oxidase cbb3-type subunit 3 [Roseovarius nanhaiticus]
MSDHKRIDDETGTETTGHSWDGIEELNTPLPRWWLWTFYATIVWGVIYVILFPAWPMVSGATQGVLGWSTRGLVAEQIEEVNLSNAEITESLVNVDLGVLPENEELHRFAVSAGRSVFANNCSQCHGAGAAGVQAAGYPNLLDDDWIWGGTLTDIAYTVRHGIRNEDDPDARWTEMPAFGDILEREEIATLVTYVRSLSGLAEGNEAGETLFLDNCAACHGDNGMGNRELGAPNLTDAIWLYGGTEEAVTETIRYSRFGVMPPWSERLGEAQVRAVAAYVHSLGGGEATVADPMTEAEAEEAASVPDASFPASAEDTPTEAGAGEVAPE